MNTFNPLMASGTTNYYPFAFNTSTKDRKVLYEGAVPLHKIVNHLYEFFYDYINTANNNTDYYLSAIESNPRGKSSTPVILKLESKKTRKKRLAFAKEKISDIIGVFTTLFNKFANNDGTLKIKYRKDTSITQFKDALTIFNSETLIQLKSLVET